MKAFSKGDPLVFWLALAATVIGLLAIYDSGYARAAADGMVVPREFRSQLISAVIALLVGGAVWQVRKKQWPGFAALMAGATFLGLILVKLVGTTINGATRWIDLKVMTVQPAEFAKFAAILVLATVLSTRKPRSKLPREPRHWAERLDWVWIPRIARGWPLYVVLAMAGLVLLEPDLATAMVIVVVSGFMLVLGKVSRGSLITLSVLFVVATSVFVMKESYRMDRILNHADRWSAENIEGIGYQTTQSEAAMASGGFMGVGLGEGRAKHKLPAPTTDFVMATVAEELGFVGSMVVLAIMGGLVWRLMVLSRTVRDQFGKLVLGGTASWIAVQSCTNMAMANGFAPPIGVPMPFVSAGGSSLLALWMAIGACQSVLRTSPEEAEEHASGRDRRWHRRPRVSRA